MLDMEKVIKGLECCLGANDCDVEPKEDCPYKGLCLCAMALRFDVLALLKEQEAVESVNDPDDPLLALCGECGHTLGFKKIFKYCPHCGKEVKWND